VFADYSFIPAVCRVTVMVTFEALLQEKPELSMQTGKV